MIQSFEHPNYVTISTKTYAVDTQKYRLDETVLLSTQKQMLKIDFLFALLHGYIPREGFSLLDTRFLLLDTRFLLLDTRLL